MKTLFWEMSFPELKDELNPFYSTSSGSEEQKQVS